MINENDQEVYRQDDEVEETQIPKGINIEDEHLFLDDLTQQARAQKRRIGQRCAGFIEKEDELLCEAWIKCHHRGRAKRSAYWRRMHTHFHEWKLIPSWQFASDWPESSLQNRWSLIQLECSKFCGSYDHTVARPTSGIGVKDIVCLLHFFKSIHYCPTYAYECIVFP